MDKLGLDRYASIYYKISIFWMGGLILCSGFGIWWSVYDIRAICIPIIDTFSIIILLFCNKMISKYIAFRNTPLKLSIIAMGFIYLSNTGLSIWSSIAFNYSRHLIANLIILWIVSFGMMLSYICFGLPLGIVFWNLRNEDVIKAQNIGGISIAPVPLPLSSRVDEISITLK